METTTKTTVEACIPFSGFYESIHQSNLESQLGVSEEDFYMAKSQEEKDAIEELYNSIKWKEQHIEYAKSYVKAFSKLLKTELEFVELNSPQYYNFTTDRIFVKIDLAFVRSILCGEKKVPQDKLAKHIEDRFTSRDGFSSFYSNDLQVWLDQWFTFNKPWDSNQIEALLEVYLEENEGEEWELDLMGDCYV